MSVPQLYVFAGPNGAGKSTLSAEMVPKGIAVFDGDAEFAKLKSFFYDLDEADIWTSVNNNSFPEWKTEMIGQHSDAAFETNFRDEAVLDTVREFMQKGYESRLLFMGLDSVEVSIERVKLRVEKGGHDVSVDYININYENSLQNLYKGYAIFTSVHLYQNLQPPGEGFELVPLVTWSGGNVIEVAGELPDWAGKFVSLAAGTEN